MSHLYFVFMLIRTILGKIPFTFYNAIKIVSFSKRKK